MDVDGFGDLFQVQHPSDVTRVGFQNCGPQRRSRYAKKSQDGAMAVSSGKYNVMLVAEHGLYPPELASSDGWHDRMCMTTKGSYACLIITQMMVTLLHGINMVVLVLLSMLTCNLKWLLRDLIQPSWDDGHGQD